MKPVALLAVGVFAAALHMTPLAAQIPTRPTTVGGAIPEVDSTKRALPPAEAYRRGWIALKDAGVDRFASEHPVWDGRGVLIAILDSGIDPSVAGLQTTSDGKPKILDLRDFSHEGRVSLRPAERKGDTLIVNGRRLLGATTLAARVPAGRIYSGVIAELPLGAPPASDLDGNGNNTDSLPVIVVRGIDGWQLIVDRDEDGTVANDQPIRDFAVARESFGWNSGGHPTPVHLAANLSDSSGTPQLDLYFDTSSHGTHVSGIAAGHDLYGVPGFDGVAPGAQVIGLKISNDAESGITVTGSITRALQYAIAFASARQMPLVVNLSFGVGNEIEGTARIDALVDSILAAHPDVVMTVAASNDGPGLSTAGFPGSASRVLSIGATEPRVFAGAAATDTLSSPLASFSSRGGEVAAPDFAVPGVAYSTVPNFAAGEEQESGTSMASPFAAGLVARLRSAAVAAGRTVTAHQVAQALRFSARAVMATTPVESGAGTPDLLSAWKWLETHKTTPAIAVDVGKVHGRGAIYIERPSPTDTRWAPAISTRNPGLTSVTLRRLDSAEPLTVRLQPSAAWIHAPATVTLSAGTVTFDVLVDSTTFERAGVSLGAIRIATDDETLGPLAILPVTVVAPVSALAPLVTEMLTVPAGGTGRLFVPSDTGRGLQIEVATLKTTSQVIAMLHEPFGMPFRDGPGSPAGFGAAAATFDIAAEDAEKGLYEVNVVTTPGSGESAKVTVRRSPVRLSAVFAHDTLHVIAGNVIGNAVTLRLRAGVIGAERQFAINQPDDAPLRLMIPVPAWATHVIVDSRMPREIWSRYTDFGVTLQERSGRQLEASPLNYAFGRTGAEIPLTLRGDSIAILLAPGFADANGSHPWNLDLTVRFLVEKPYMLDDGSAAPRSLGVSAARDERMAMSRLPITLPAGFDPLVILVALEGEDHIWTRQVRLPVTGGVPK